MFRPECPGFLVGAPLIAVEALVALRDLIASLHTAAECAKASLNQPPKEEVSEAISQRSEPTTKSSASQRSGSGPTQRQATGTNIGGRGNARQRSTRSRKPSGKLRKR